MWHYFCQDRFFERATLTNCCYFLDRRNRYNFTFFCSPRSIFPRGTTFANLCFFLGGRIWYNVIFFLSRSICPRGGGTPQQTLAIFSAVEFRTMQHSLFFCQDSFSARSHLNKPLLFSRWWIWYNITFVLLSGSIFLCRATLTNCDYFPGSEFDTTARVRIVEKNCPSEVSLTSPCYLLGGRILYNVTLFFLPRSIFPRGATLTNPCYFLGGRIWYNATLFVFVKIDCSAQGHLHKPLQFSRWSNLIQCDILLFVKIDFPRGVTLTNPCYFLGGRIWYNVTFFILPISIFPRGPP